MTRIRRFEIRPRERFLLLQLIRRWKEDPPERLEEALKDGLNRFWPKTVPTLGMETFPMAALPKSLREEPALEKAISTTLVVGTGGPALAESRKNSEGLGREILALLEEEAAWQCCLFGLRISRQTAREEWCDLTDPLNLTDRQEVLRHRLIAQKFPVEKLGLTWENGTLSPCAAVWAAGWLPMKKGKR